MAENKQPNCVGEVYIVHLETKPDVAVNREGTKMSRLKAIKAGA